MLDTFFGVVVIAVAGYVVYKMVTKKETVEEAVKEMFITMVNEGKIDPKIRKNSVVWINERDKDLNWMYQRLAGVAMNLNDQFFKFDF